MIMESVKDARDLRTEVIHVINAGGAMTEEFDIDAILDEITGLADTAATRYDLDTVPSDVFWEIVKRHAKETEVPAPVVTADPLETLRGELAAVRGEYAAFRRNVVTLALAHAEESRWCDEVYEVLEELGLTEKDGVEPEERQVEVRITIPNAISVTVKRGERLDTEDVEEELVDWVRSSFSSRHWVEA